MSAGIKKLIDSFKADRVSIVWKHMLMMVCILSLSLVALLLIHKTSLDTIRKEQVEKTMLSLKRDCDKLDNTMYATYAIPAAIEDTRHYFVISGEKSNSLDKKYLPQLNLIRNSLSNQLYLMNDCETYLIYLSGTNSICSDYRISAAAEDYFGKWMTFETTPSSILIAHLKERGTVQLLPLQQIIHDKSSTPVSCLPLIIHPTDSSIAVMTLYSEEYLLNALNMHNLPSGTLLRITASDGQTLMNYPKNELNSGSEEYLELNYTLKSLNAAVTLLIPDSYFGELLFPVRRIGAIAIILVLTVGLALSLLFSRVSVRPLRKLISLHNDSDTELEQANEILHMDHLLNTAREKNRLVQLQLARQLLARVFNGSVLSEPEEAKLLQAMGPISSSYRAAILSTSGELNGMIGEYLETTLDDILWTLISDKETGFVFHGDDATLQKLSRTLEPLIMQLQIGSILCGVSTQTSESGMLHRAVRQARSAMPETPGIRVYSGDELQNTGLSWLQHQRLYQSIFTNEEEDACCLLQSIESHITHVNARSVFYNVRFVLQSAAEEMSLHIPDLSEQEFIPNLSPTENFDRLRTMLRTLFAYMRSKNENIEQNAELSILDYLQNNLHNYDLCAATVSQKFSILEPKVYKIIRNQTGMSFNEYLSMLRTSKAAGLLYSTHLSLTDIAAQCGYRVASTFYRQFNDRYGVSPGQYRKNRAQNTSGQKHP